MNFTRPLAVGAVICAIIGLPAAPAVWAFGGGGIPTCLVGNPGGGALAIRGVLAVTVTSMVGTSLPQDADFVLRLERSGVMRFYRSHQVTPLSGLSAEEVVCRAVDQINNSDPAVAILVGQILTDFGPGKTRLVITDKSVTNAEALTNAVVVPGTIPAHAASMADVLLYAQ